MSYVLTDFTAFVDRETDALTATLFIGGDTGRFAMFMSGIKGKTEIPTLSGSAKLQAGTCNSASGTTTADTVDIEVKPWTYYEGFCEADLQNKFPNMVLAPGSDNQDSPWQETIVNMKVASIQEQLELHYWQGNTAGSTYTLFDGFIKKIDAATGVLDGNTGSIEAITQANIIAAVDAMFVKVPAKVKRTGNAVIVVGDDYFDLYIAALKAANLYHYTAEHDNGVLKIGGSRGTLQRVYGLDGTDRMFAGIGSSLIVGADKQEENDNPVMKIWYDETDDKVYFRAKGKSGVTIANPTEIVEFTLAT